jgi:phospholipid transport system substrate-binding protein
MRSLLATALIVLALSLPATVSAYYPPQPYPPTPQVFDDPGKLLADALARIRQFTGSGIWRNPPQARAFLETGIVPYFDFEFMAAWTARPFYQQMDTIQQARFRQLMKERFIALLMGGMGTYVEPFPAVRLFPARRLGPDRADVMAEVMLPPGYPARILFHFRGAQDGWKLFDASMNGVSGLYLFRQYLMQSVQQHGPGALFAQ